MPVKPARARLPDRVASQKRETPRKEFSSRKEKHFAARHAEAHISQGVEGFSTVTRNSRPPRFKPFQAPMAIAVQKLVKAGNYRGSPRDRGYDSKWDRLSIAYRKRHVCCAWCAQQDRDTLTDLVDHIIPVVDRPDLKYTWSNLWALCKHHHAQKGVMEVYARENGLLNMLPEWCRQPEKRPLQFRPVA
ncbi:MULTISPECIES: HNH endonuclease signature motif containing protein [Mesorhizobium]|uniref:HNH endonuclease n=1 Tax=Mesorhizobium TaxID=68287 RepID=UPI000FCA8550|nr:MULTISPECIES: HNH endonuclease signature motif containing protein [Mesorhizobium]MDF3208362.1 HNH endonuclease signature motif containing protein [Mesorhizobium sp. LMG15046]MDF3229066.1 HNH endonuclease signature motif containing protein [Mesorhizobium sp. DSM 30133]RUU22178.1 HNH endonuclease [Mesorhizobium sp. Primo-B]RUU37912.1 HNH endonuclease [Mesorhizobium sp. Primo-A]RVB69351.1 HNH endonuclease [Mesorhizobium sp. M7A.F.Ca.CA.002.03.2.1]